ncbi:ATPase domain-containing protein [Thermococcus gammatolerans]|uniref:non-specific serine/threonine protein kinase n=1 Tax=Thermococcus gammatolerans (strain DSM 15229 / JCM 11827 / EJ3) TaxID=593117 RepID=C5A470_THEGJ|nr:ATPase domain-containing protein [Thermococcus gammatolerans]ACS33032.1 RecA family AAA ATPase [Thermococcus gammatolerans EJ3]
MELIPTGIPGLDKALSGGFSRGTSILIAGNPGTGKTHLAVHVLFNNMKKGLKGAYISFAETKRQFYQNAMESGLNFEEAEKKGVFKFYDMLTMPKEEMKDFLDFLIQDLVEWKPDIIVFDSITVLGQIFGAAMMRSFLHSIIGRLVNALNSLAILIDEIPYGERRVGFGVEEFVVDGVIVLEMERQREVIKRYLTIPKMRGRYIARSTYEYVITDYGIDVIPIPDLRFAERNIQTKERIKTGIPKFDELLGGGFYKGSINLIAGPTGSGKTIFALTIASNMAKQGFRVLYMTFEEALGALLGTTKNLGLDGDFKVISLIPEAMTPIQYYALIKRLLRENSSEILFIDSISAMQSHMEEEDFIKAIRYLQLLSKEKNITLIMTYLSQNSNLLQSTGFSTLMDTITILSYELPSRPGEFLKRYLMVLKARHSEHKAVLRKFKITLGGIEIE